MSKRPSRRRTDSRSPRASSPAVRRTMQANRAKDTGPERALREALSNAGIRGYRLNWVGAPGRPDLAFPGRKIAVFVHGCFWHHCAKCQQSLPQSNRQFWRAKFAANRARDRRKRTLLEAAGWSVLELRECELRSDQSMAVREVTRVLYRSTID
jgi:DNA mismatch endonuclease (patch repair protein)